MNLLDDFSRGFEKYLLNHFPQWKQYLKRENDNGEMEYLSVSVPSPSKNEDSVLLILTNNDEITIGFGKYHNHESVYTSFEETYQNSIEFIDDFINERIIVLIEKEKERVRQCSVIQNDDPIPKSDGIVKYYTHSWKGTYNTTNYD